MKKFFTFLLMVFSLSFFSSCSSNESSDLEFVGSDTLLELIQAESEAFYKDKNIPINVSGGGSGVGINMILQNQISLADASREITQEELIQAKNANISLKQIPIAKDLLMVVLNKSNPIKNLTKEQLKNIYLGRITNWKEVGGTDAPISLYGRQSSSGTYLFFQETILEKHDYSKNVKEMTGNPQLLQAVIADKGAIAYVGMGYALNQQKDINIISLNEINPVQESNFKKYPLSRYLYQVLKGVPSEKERIWFSYLFSEKGQNIVKQVGFLPLTKKEIEDSFLLINGK